MNSNFQWFNRSLPQTLVNAQMLCYFEAVLSIIQGRAYQELGFIVAAGLILSAAGIANEMKWGYYLAICVSIAKMALTVWYLTWITSFSLIIDLVFDIVLVALVLHTMSRSHVKIWFK